MDSLLTYFKEAEKVLEANQFENDDDYDTFMQNVFSEVDGKEYRLSCSNHGSKILEKILRGANPHQLRVFYAKSRERYLDMCCHIYASHVAETWLLSAVNSGVLNATKADEETDQDQQDQILPNLASQLQDLSDLCTSSFGRLAQDIYGTHILRKLLLLSVGELDGYKSILLEQKGKSLLITQLADSLDRKLLLELALGLRSGPVLQLLLHLLSRHDVDQMRALIERFFPGWGSSEIKADTLKTLSKLLNHEVGSRFLEALISVLSTPDYIWFHNQVIRKQVDDIIKGNHSNFVLQCHISRCPNAGQLLLLVDSLQPHASNLVVSRRHGILLRLAQWVIDHQLESASAVLDFILSAFHFPKNHQTIDGLFSCVSRMQLRESADFSRPLLASGCSLLQSIVRFPEESIKPFVDSLLEMEVEALVELCLHPNGSHTMQSFFDSRMVSEKVKLRIVRRLIFSMARLAIDKSGSHVVDTCWRIAKADIRRGMVDIFLASETKLKDSPYGRIVLGRCRIEDYQHNAQNWTKAESAIDRKRSMFADIIDDPEPTNQTNSIQEPSIPSLLPAGLMATVKKSKKLK